MVDFTSFYFIGMLFTFILAVMLFVMCAVARNKVDLTDKEKFAQYEKLETNFFCWLWTSGMFMLLYFANKIWLVIGA